MTSALPPGPDVAARPMNRRAQCAEVALIVTLFFVLAGTPPPDVNEAHYLAKARHYWDPSWCPGDSFLDSADAHLVFYWTFGWLTRLLPLPAVAWIGRFLTWSLLAWSWQRLSWTLLPRRFFSVLSAALFAVLLDRGHMAGEWVIGGVEAKGIAYVLVLRMLDFLARGRWRSALVAAGAATALHVLVGGWSCVALAWTWLRTGPSQRMALRACLPAASLAAALACLGLGPALRLSWSADADVAAEAHRIYVFERLPHHLVFHRLPHAYIARHAALVLAWVALRRWRRALVPETAGPLVPLDRFVTGAVLIAVSGAVLDQSLLYFRPLAAAILRFYWFRLSDVAVPMGVACALSALLAGLTSRHPAMYGWALALTLLLAGSHVAGVAWGHFQSPTPGAWNQSQPAAGLPPGASDRRFRDWLRVCQWIRENTRRDRRFLTPRHQQTFKWYAQRSEVVCAKDIPQDASGIVAWRERLDDVFPWSARLYDLTAHGEQGILALAGKYSFDYVVIDRDMSSAMLHFPRLFPADRGESSTYAVYLVPRRPAGAESHAPASPSHIQPPGPGGPHSASSRRAIPGMLLSALYPRAARTQGNDHSDAGNARTRLGPARRSH